MDHNSDIADFLTTRRARITPEQAGLPSYGARRVPGLRREEVASLAGVSVEYYKRLERGNVSGVSDLVLEALEAGSASQQALDLLGSWTASPDVADVSGERSPGPR